MNEGSGNKEDGAGGRGSLPEVLEGGCDLGLGRAGFQAEELGWGVGGD